jgi:NAD-dependent deacetylase
MRKAQSKNIVILTGAGISVESGIRSFRDNDGFWDQYDQQAVATPNGFRKDPQRVLNFYNLARKKLVDFEPNAAHIALAKLQQEYNGNVTIITQNVDDLHERNTGAEVIHMHGELRSGLCNSCNHRWLEEYEQTLEDECENCGKKTCRPDVVWFNEVPYHMEKIKKIMDTVDVFVAIGTSGEVYPAAGFAATAQLQKAKTIEINLNPSFNRSFSQVIKGPATETVPLWVEKMLEENKLFG